MKLRAGILDRYIARHVMVATAGVWVVLTGLVVILNFSEQLGHLGRNGYTFSHAVLQAFYTLPRWFYILLPMAAVVGSLMGLGGLASRSELTAVRAAGVSKLRIGAGSLLALCALTALMVLNMETVGPAAEQRAQALEGVANPDAPMLARGSGLWAREGNVYLNARSGVRHRRDGQDVYELQDVRLYQMSDDGRLLSLTHARLAAQQAQGWLLQDVERTRFLDRSVEVVPAKTQLWKSELNQQSLEAALSGTRYISTRELSSNIDYLRRNHLDASKFESEYWGRWFYPLNIIALVLATLPFAFGSLRSGGFGKQLFIGIVLGIGFYLGQRLFLDLSDVYRFDVRLAYVLPLLVLLGVSWGYFGRRA